MRVALIGSGNVATALGRLSIRNGHEVVHVLSRNISHAEILAKEFNSSFSDYTIGFEADADLFILAVSDSAIAECINKLILPNSKLVHTAGSISKDVLKSASENYGVLYPLQTIRRETEIQNEIPFLIDANNENTYEVINSFARSLSSTVERADDSERLKLHAAAVVVSNFPNHLYLLAEEFCKKENILFSILQPLILETSLRLNFLSPAKSQTGPAFRNDSLTITKHLELLKNHPELHEVYKKLTESIQRMG
ncbi:MAG: DUF2520 domain-containing protein [Ferruginibacter sp.]